MSDSVPASRTLSSPRYWPSRLGLALVRGVARLPQRWQRRLAALLGWLAQGLLVMRKRVAARNLAVCFPELDEAARARLLADNLRDSGRMLVEFAVAWFGSDDAIAAIPCRVTGLEHLAAAREQGRGVLLVGGHFSHLELCARLVSRRIRISGMYRVMDDPVFEQAVLAARLRYADAMFTKDELRATVKYLRRGGTVWYAPDQDMRGKDSVFVPFFGVPASTITATHHLARLSGALVLPFFHRRDADGGYTLRLEAPLADFPSDDAVADTARVNAAIEAMVREAPSQYLWLHKRFKTRPAGGAPLY
ncbi:MAG TPA: LpxL/LpxP family Kdo(2)-lipid IV(A) lauroyl/palmitoleoyl acyltransferase [Tahibacter sp.]|uniref:LpxL/LpxP family Kdo(2)-lipid IV(A) lauroyl/palmitoleoyl acyltransferase n=1 Tax=Tahibacter sp. TaxID=2056211 RepID=UPI002D112590|nr:LpxL/LpxP family Kdo(2)-lipid IV(A) lauroyl/palmitoleoyl acyltransferase [Tahibacter sp.]HSX62476.1 LpxL/LpxP family Kdo(2)-lipid IV(A) lauroyl/palmitoleoyl acyltransferase [Tahibacter sp.]